MSIGKRERQAVKDLGRIAESMARTAQGLNAPVLAYLFAMAAVHAKEVVAEIDAPPRPRSRGG